jgi:hypothetical protein
VVAAVPAFNISPLAGSWVHKPAALAQRLTPLGLGPPPFAVFGVSMCRAARTASDAQAGLPHAYASEDGGGASNDCSSTRVAKPS